MSVPRPRLAFAGDRDVAVQVLDHLLAAGDRPLALLVSDADRASHAHALRARCAHLPDDLVLVGRGFREPEGIARLRALALDLVVCVHFPYVVPDEVLALPRVGVLNLHPALLPWNRGWHTPSWAILDGTPIGATLHFMDRGVDTGDVVHQRELAVREGDTAHALYARLKALEVELFAEAWPALVAGTYARRAQPAGGSSRRRAELFTPEVQRLELDAPTTARAVLRRLRALTTSDPRESAYFEDGDGRRLRVRVTIEPEDPAPDDPGG